MNDTRPAYDGTQNCSGANTEIFFGVGARVGPHRGMYSEAREICEGCPLLTDCFQYALIHDVQGFWAGTTEEQRKATRTLLGIRPISFLDHMSELLGADPGMSYCNQALGELKRCRALWAALPIEEALEALQMAKELVMETASARARSRRLNDPRKKVVAA